MTGDSCNGSVLTGTKYERVAEPPKSAAAARLTDPFNYPLTALSAEKAVAELAPIVTAIQPAGAATIDGVGTTKFLLTVSNPQMQSFMGGGQQVPPPDPTVRFAVAMWVDASNRLRQSQITVMAPGQPTETVTNRYSHFGTPVTITIPPVSEVVQGPC